MSLLRPLLAGILLTAAAVAALMPFAWAASERAGGWTSYRNARYGFMIAYPSGVFAPDPERESEEGRAVVSADGRARLLVGAFDNAEGTTLAQYREFLLKESYPGATLDYAPVKERWFVLSGTQSDKMFYERVTFTCGGRIINSWAMVYPLAERRVYDRIIERVAKTYTAGAGARGTCE
jgi:hypothetical protein